MSIIYKIAVEVSILIMKNAKKKIKLIKIIKIDLTIHNRNNKIIIMMIFRILIMAFTVENYFTW